MPLMKIKGDTIYYSDPQNSPVYFKVQNDTLHTYGNEVTHYHIDKLGQYVFWLHSLSDEVVKLQRSEDADDSLAFSAGGGDNSSVQATRSGGKSKSLPTAWR